MQLKKKSVEYANYKNFLLENKYISVNMETEVLLAN